VIYRKSGREAKRLPSPPSTPQESRLDLEAAPPAPAQGPPTRWARRLALAAHLGLMAALPAAAGAAGAVLALPLLAPLPGLWRGRPYTHAWASMLVLFYVGGFLMEAWARPHRAALSIALAALAAGEFCALLLYVRFRAAEARRAAQGG